MLLSETLTCGAVVELLLLLLLLMLLLLLLLLLGTMVSAVRMGMSARSRESSAVTSASI
jgi:hypothetical protein